VNEPGFHDSVEQLPAVLGVLLGGDLDDVVLEQPGGEQVGDQRRGG
jgi:hypothetical protein